MIRALKFLLGAAILLAVFGWAIYPDNTTFEGAGGYWAIFMGKIALAFAAACALTLLLAGIKGLKYLLIVAAVILSAFIINGIFWKNSVVISEFLPQRSRSAVLIESIEKQGKAADKAVSALVKESSGNAAVIPALVSALEDKTGNVSNNATKALGLIGKPAVPHLIETLRTRLRARYRAAIALSYMGPEAAEAVPALMEVLEQSLVRRERFESLGKESLIAAFEKDDSRIGACLGSIAALQKIGPSAKDAVPLIKEAMNDPREVIRMTAESALKENAVAWDTGS